MKRADAEAIEGAPELYSQELAERFYQAIAAVIQAATVSENGQSDDSPTICTLALQLT
jgi:hypothetical protein